MGSYDWLSDLDGFYRSKDTLASAGGKPGNILSNHLRLPGIKCLLKARLENHMATVGMASTSLWGELSVFKCTKKA